MTPEEFRRWRERRAYTLDTAPRVLGISRRMVAYYDYGERAIPRLVASATRALEANWRSERRLDRPGRGACFSDCVAGNVYPINIAPEMVMLRLALFFLVVSLVAALFGFTGISAATAGIAKVLFFLFIVGFLIVLFVGLMIGSAFW